MQRFFSGLLFGFLFVLDQDRISVVCFCTMLVQCSCSHTAWDSL